MFYNKEYFGAWNGLAYVVRGMPAFAELYSEFEISTNVQASNMTNKKGQIGETSGNKLFEINDIFCGATRHVPKF